MPNRKSSGKMSVKPARQLLFSEALQHSRPVASAPDPQLVDRPTLITGLEQDNTIERIPQEITAVGRRLEGMDSTMSTLAAETKSICLDIASFQSRMTGLEQCVTAMEDHLNTVPERDQELLFLRSKLIDLEDRSHRDNVRFFGFPERIEGPNIQAFLQKIIPTLTSLTFYRPLEFQRAYHRGLKRPDRVLRPDQSSLASCATLRSDSFSRRPAPLVCSVMKTMRSALL
ncbi:hypothetical protein NDU88_001345 [Pleurodeles waltl]|uniref:Uncharacterized protein n=1 Tax=Pleurodeles waltl TaxID=8319 RepID=A0AAV7WMD8_PLEWA|nr:hypothetical protein NDU88_001345 [Pleurodeles waltl]